VSNEVDFFGADTIREADVELALVPSGGRMAAERGELERIVARSHSR
jgi:Zn-finger nucleic acid-binding protein